MSKINILQILQKKQDISFKQIYAVIVTLQQPEEERCLAGNIIYDFKVIFKQVLKLKLESYGLAHF